MTLKIIINVGENSLRCPHETDSLTTVLGFKFEAISPTAVAFGGAVVARSLLNAVFVLVLIKK